MVKIRIFLKYFFISSRNIFFTIFFNQTKKYNSKITFHPILNRVVKFGHYPNKEKKLMYEKERYTIVAIE